MNTVHNTRGFTLIELLLYVTIVGGMLTAVSVFFATTVDARVKSQSVAEVDQQGALVMDYITQTIRGADSVTTPAVAGTGATLTLVVPTGSLSPTIFNLDGGGTILQVKEGTGAVIPLTNSKVSVSNLIFRNLSRSGTPGVIQVSFTLDRVNTTGRNEYSYQKTFTSTAALRYP